MMLCAGVETGAASVRVPRLIERHMNTILSRPAGEDTTLRISFPDDTLGFDGANLSVQFRATVDGLPVICAIAAEENWRIISALEYALLAVFRHGCLRIRPVCAEALGQNDGASVVLHSGLFRVEVLDPEHGRAAWRLRSNCNPLVLLPGVAGNHWQQTGSRRRSDGAIRASRGGSRE